MESRNWGCETAHDVGNFSLQCGTESAKPICWESKSPSYPKCLGWVGWFLLFTGQFLLTSYFWNPCLPRQHSAIRLCVFTAEVILPSSCSDHGWNSEPHSDGNQQIYREEIQHSLCKSGSCNTTTSQSACQPTFQMVYGTNRLVTLKKFILFIFACPIWTSVVTIFRRKFSLRGNRQRCCLSYHYNFSG